MKLSVVIPAYNEEESIEETIQNLVKVLIEFNIEHEILVINDNSKDSTETVLEKLVKKISTLKYVTNLGPNGFGYAIRYGLERFNGDCVAIMMADLSDSPYDLVKFYKTMLENNVDCVFGSRFAEGGVLIDYPFVKKIIRVFSSNLFIEFLRIKRFYLVRNNINFII